MAYYDKALGKFVTTRPEPQPGTKTEQLVQAPPAAPTLAALQVPAHPILIPREWLLSEKVGANPVQSISEVLVDPSVYIADAARVKDFEKLKSSSIKYVLSLAKLPAETILKTPAGILNSNQDSNLARAGLERKIAFFEDSEAANPEQILYAYKCMKELYKKAQSEGVGLVVHCEAGCSRSPLLVAAFIAKHSRMTLKQSLEHISPYRHFSIKEELAVKLCETLGVAIE